MLWRRHVALTFTLLILNELFCISASIILTQPYPKELLTEFDVVCHDGCLSVTELQKLASVEDSPPYLRPPSPPLYVI